MIIEDYKELIKITGFEEFPFVFTPDKDYLSKIIVYNETDTDLKIYLAKLIICRSFYGTYTSWYMDVEWFINSFFREYRNDFIKTEITETIKEAVAMIMSDDIFTKRIIGTTFMFGAIEFYAKYKLGFRPLAYNFFDPHKKDYIKNLAPKEKQNDLTIRSAFKYLQKQNLRISITLNHIDDFTIKRLSEEGIESTNWRPHTIAERLSMARNPMLHGELYSFYDKGPYLIMLYILFHLHDQREEKDSAE